VRPTVVSLAVGNNDFVAGDHPFFNQRLNLAIGDRFHSLCDPSEKIAYDKSARRCQPTYSKNL